MDILLFPKAPFRQDLLDDCIMDLAEPSFPKHDRHTWHKVGTRFGTRLAQGQGRVGAQLAYFGVSHLGS